jgi:hypothetical protein
MSVRSALAELGELSVRSESDFEQLLGSPTAFRILSTGNRLVEWRSGRFDAQSVIVVFDASKRFVDVAATRNVRRPEPLVEPRDQVRRAARVEGRRNALDLFTRA